MVDFSTKKVMTFDCYGTLIDWDTGVHTALQPILNKYNVKLPREQMLENFAEFEAKIQQGPYMSYREVLATVLNSFGQRFNFTPLEQELVDFSSSVQEWPTFPDSTQALLTLQHRFKLAILSNIDDDLFAVTNRKLGVSFDWIITAQQARSYKPSLNNFRLAFERIGQPQNQILHVAQSLFHDHVPAKQLGLTTVWINRRHEKAGLGATPPTQAQPDLEVPDMETLARIATI